MSEILGATVGAVAVIAIPLIGWLSRRASREGRLALRVERLGAVYALMPDSPEKETFKVHLTSAIGNLNSWLDSDNLKRRMTLRRIQVGTYVLGVGAVLVSLPFANAATSPWFSSVLGAAIGLAISGVTFAAAFVLERGARRQAVAQEKAREESAAAERIKALLRVRSS